MDKQGQYWDTAIQSMITLAFADPMPSQAAKPQCLLLPMRASVASLQFVDVTLSDTDKENGYRAQIVIEWSGDHLLVIPVNWFQPFGQPGELDAYSHLELTCCDRGPLEAVLTMGSPQWAGRMPLIAVNEREQLLDLFTAPGFWEQSMWKATGGQGEWDKMWLYARLSAQTGANRPGFVSYTKQYDMPIERFQALLIGLSTDELADFRMYIVVDGVRRLAVDRKKGCGFEELRVELDGSVLNAITLELHANSPWHEGAQEQQFISLLYWIMLENAGADPNLANEVYGSEDIELPLLSGEFTEELLPNGFLINKVELQELRSKISQGESESARMYKEMVVEAEENLAYRPESYLGAYMPVNWARQGIERASSPNEETRRLYSTLVYSSFVYAVGGDLRFGLAARKALLTVARMEHWAAGFVARYPLGLRGYRAPFIESHTSQAVALCYDFIYPLLSSGEQHEVEDALYEKGTLWLDAFLRQNGEGYLLGSNQGAVYALGLLYSAHVAKRSHPEAAQVAERWTLWFERMISGYYKSDGSTNEGMMYWEYTTHSAIEALLIISSQSGHPVRELLPSSLKQTMNYIMNVRSLAYPTLRFLPLGDCRNEDFHFMGPPLLFFARYMGHKRAFTMWKDHYAAAHAPGSTFFGAPVGTGQYSSNGLLTLLLYKDESTTASELPRQQLFMETERLFWRTGSAYGDKLFFFEGGPQSFEHTHFDKGQFILEAYGESLATDPGTIDYSKPFSTLLKATKFHNVVTVNGKDQSYKDASRAVVIQSLVEREHYHFLHADLTNSYQELISYQRRILFVRPDYWLVMDEVEATEAGLEWHLHSKGSYRALVDEHTVDHRIFHYAAQASLAGLRLSIVSDGPLDPSLSTYRDEEIVLSHHLSLRTDSDSRQLRLAAVLVPYSGTYSDVERTVDVHAERSSGEAIFVVTGSFGADRITCSLQDMRVRVERESDGAVITVS